MHIIFDIETDGIDATKIHCFSYKINNTIQTITDYKGIINFFDNHKEDILVGHYISVFDIPVLERILGIKISNDFIDTLSLSWYLYSYLTKHGLEDWGETFDLNKIKITDWLNLSIDEYIRRCETDTEINSLLFEKEMKYLNKIYNDNVTEILKYLQFKMNCLRDNQTNKFKLDIYKAKEIFFNLDFELANKMLELKKIMPKIKDKHIPKILYKKDGTLSVHGKEWFELLKEQGLPEDSEWTYKEPNPGSTTQLKDWLFSLGWKPITFNTTISKKNGINKVPQIGVGEKGELCPSVLLLKEKEPGIQILEMFSKTVHRRNHIKSYLDCEKDGYLASECHGFTNTVRFTHSKPLVNIPKVSLYMGKEIRSTLTCDEGELLCGIDVKSLEATTADHYMYFFDPEYVTRKQTTPDFDSHLELGVIAGMITPDEAKEYKRLSKLDKDLLTNNEKIFLNDIGIKRFKSKTVNFSAIYGAGPAKISLSSGLPLGDANILHKSFWEINWSIKAVSRAVTVKDVWNHKWLFNPVSKKWLYVKNEKDVFSTLNQSTGVFVFDTFIKYMLVELKEFATIIFQYHDEIVIKLKEKYRYFVEDCSYKAIKKLNEELKLNTEIKVDIKFGYNYAEIH